jgi:molecular chaperone GrpE (heat shock protein)
MRNLEQQKADLEEKILAKRQQADFERANIEIEKEFSTENTTNPDVSEEFKNFNDPAKNVVEGSELKALSKTVQELNYLIDELNRLNKI